MKFHNFQNPIQYHNKKNTEYLRYAINVKHQTTVLDLLDFTRIHTEHIMTVL